MNPNELKAQMVRANVSQKELCDKIGISAASFYRKMTGKSEFNQGEISAIARELNLSKDTIYAVFFAN